MRTVRGGENLPPTPAPAQAPSADAASHQTLRAAPEAQGALDLHAAHRDVEAGRAALAPTSWRPLAPLFLQSALDAGIAGSVYSAFARSTWGTDPFHYRPYGLGAAAVTAASAFTMLATDRDHVARRLLQSSAWAMVALSTSCIYLPDYVDRLRGSARPEWDDSLPNVLSGAAFSGVCLTVAIAMSLRSLAAGAADAQRHFGRVPVGQGRWSTVSYSAAAAAAACVGVAIGLHGLVRGEGTELAAGFGVASLAVVPAIFAMLTATWPRYVDSHRFPECAVPLSPT